MFTFLKNRFISSTIAVIGAAEGAKEKLGLQQQNSKRTSTTSDHPFNNNNYFSLPRSTPYQSAGPNLMDEEYFLRKFDEYEKNDTWEYVFQSINLESEAQAKKMSLCCDVSNSFHDKNRYRNVLPYDQNRITLKCVANENEAYINASPLHLPFARRNYILTQGPLPNTASDFWQMVYEQKVSICIMLSKVMEKSFIKCHSYFPTSDVKKLKFEHFECELEHEEQKPNYIIRRIRLTSLESFRRMDQQRQQDQNATASSITTAVPPDSNGKQPLQQPNGSRIIYHFQFTTWPDFGVPEHTDHFLEFLEEVRGTREKLLEKDSGSNEEAKSAASPPIVCHCSAGIGRTGTFVIVDSVVSMIERKRQQQSELIGISAGTNTNNNDSSSTTVKDKKVEEQLNSLEALVIYIRQHRMGLIQTTQQLRFCWKTIVDWIKKNNVDDNNKSENATSATIFQLDPNDSLPNSPHSSAAASSPATSQQHQPPASPRSPWDQFAAADQEEDQQAKEPPPKSATLTDIRWSTGAASPSPSQTIKSPTPTVMSNSNVVNGSKDGSTEASTTAAAIARS